MLGEAYTHWPLIFCSGIGAWLHKKMFLLCDNRVKAKGANRVDVVIKVALFLLMVFLGSIT